MSLEAFSDKLTRSVPSFPEGAVAMLFDEDGVAVLETLDHLLRLGFSQVVLVSRKPPELSDPQNERTLVLTPDRVSAEFVFGLLNHAITLMPGRWVHYCYNAEFLHFPFCETRSIGELTAFHAEERRDAMLTYTIDLYAGDLSSHKNGVDLSNAYFDKSGYYAQDRHDAYGERLDRQWDFYGGLRWRFEEHIPKDRRRIDRVGIVRAKPGLVIYNDHTTSIPEYNTVSCEWHHNLTATITSFRVAKALKANPGSRHAIPSFWWHNSVKFDWSSPQLMELGLMEPGQWF